MTDSSAPSSASSLPLPSSRPSTHFGVDISTAPKQHLPVLLHSSAAVTSFPPSLSSSPAEQICFFDLETTFPTRSQPASIVEFGCLLIDRCGWYELGSFSSLVRPAGAALGSGISKRSIECNGITEAMVASSPSFAQLAPSIHALMHGRLWCGHNIKAFDIPKLQAAFDAVQHPQPTCLGVIDSLLIVRQRFRDRAAGSNSMAALSKHFGLGEEKHRAVSDCRMTLEAMRGVALTLLMEREMPELFPTPVIPPRVYAKRESKDGQPDAAADDGERDGAEKEEEKKKEGNEAAAEAAQAELKEDGSAGIDALKPAGGASAASPVSPASTPVKRGRGRPRKHPLPLPTAAPEPSVEAVVAQLQTLTVTGAESSEKEPEPAALQADAEDELEDETETNASGYEILQEEDEQAAVDAAADSSSDAPRSAGARDGLPATPSSPPVSVLSPSSAVAVSVSPSAQSPQSRLFALLETSIRQSSAVYAVYRGSNPQYHTAVRCMTGLQWESQPVTFSAVLPHNDRHAARVREEGAGAAELSDGVRLTFAVRNIRELRDSRDGQPLWTAQDTEPVTQ